MIAIKNEKDIKTMREGGKILKSIIANVVAAVKSGVTTRELDALAHQLLKDHKVKPAFLNYGGFPSTICLSVNDEVVHGLPSDRELQQGDIIGIDMGLIYESWNLDSAVTIPVLGDLSERDWRQQNPDKASLIDVTKASLKAGIEKAKIGSHVGDIGAEIQAVVEKAGFSIVRDLVGHGIGKKLHEEPHVPNYGKKGEGPILKEGMVIAIEPITTAGKPGVHISTDGFTYTSADHSLSAHFEHTIAITRRGPWVLTG